jgi:hypothetical protein
MLLQSDQYRLKANTPWEKALCFSWIAGSLLYYWSVFFRYPLDAGQADDFVDALWFFEIYQGQEHWLDKLAVIALPNHEHVTIFNHLVYLAHYALFKQINFFHYMLIGHLLILVCCLLFAEWLQKTVGWWYALALAFGLFLNLFYWHASFWAITALSNQAVVLFALLAARSAARAENAITAPLVWSLLAVTTQFNGLLVLPALVASSFIVARIEGRPQNWCQLLVWTGFFIVTAVAYVIYENPLAHDHLWRYVNYTDPEHLADYTRAAGEGVASGIAYLWNVPLTLLSTAGGSVFDQTQWILAVMLGSVLLGLLLLTGVRSPSMPDRFWWALLFFVVTSITLVAIGRGSIFGPASGMQYRYRLYSFMLVVLFAGSALRIKPAKLMLWALMLAALFVQLCSLHVLDDISAERKSVEISHYNWLVDGGMGRTQMPFYPHNQDRRLLNAYQSGYYNPYEAIDARHRPVKVASIDSAACNTGEDLFPAAAREINVWSKKAKALAVEIQLGIEPSANPIELLFCDNKAAYVVTLDKKNLDHASGKYSPILVLKKQLPPSQYHVLLRRDGGRYKALGEATFP